MLGGMERWIQQLVAGNPARQIKLFKVYNDKQQVAVLEVGLCQDGAEKGHK